jgi:hypothetical protein
LAAPVSANPPSQKLSVQVSSLVTETFDGIPGQSTKSVANDENARFGMPERRLEICGETPGPHPVGGIRARGPRCPPRFGLRAKRRVGKAVVSDKDPAHGAQWEEARAG